jgi:uncharacterized coiled-coil DUF342 family protein
MHSKCLDESLKNLARASRDFAELRLVYKDPEMLCADIRAALAKIDEKQEQIDRLTGRVNEIRNSRDELLVGVQAVMKKFDFTMRSV